MTQYSGLCSCCKNAVNCNYLRTANSPIWQCEEFEGFECKPTNQKPEIPKKHSLSAARTTEKTNSDFLGLCRNCENSNTCKFPKPEGVSGTVRSISKQLSRGI